MTEYVNAYGQSIDPFHTPSALAPKPVKASRAGLKAVNTRQDAKESNGFKVLGHSPERIRLAREAHERLQAMACGAGGAPIPPWNEAEWLQKNKAKPMHSRPYALGSAAQECAEIARKSGWLAVEVVEMLRG